jgi:integrin beta 3
MADDIQEMADSVFETVTDYVTRAIRPLLKRIAELEERQPEKGEPGKDGAGVAGATINRDGELLLTMSDGRLVKLGRVDGHDGLGFDDLAVDCDGERTVTFRFAQGERVKEFPIVFPVVLDRGVYRAEEQYAKGDAVSFGGSQWIAQEATTDKPETGAAWRLAVKRGRDGKNGKDGRDGERGLAGPEGRAGRDLTQMGPDGSKW